MDDSDHTQPGASERRAINVHVVFDVDSLLRYTIGPGDHTPTSTSIDLNLGHMVVTGNGTVTNQGTGDVAFEARTGDIIRFFANSGSKNFHHAVLIVDIRHERGGKVLEGCEFVRMERMSVAPAPGPDEFTVQFVRRQFYFCQCEVAGEGTGSYCLELALYDRDEHGRPRFTGLYQWKPQFTVQSTHNRS